MTRTTRAKIKQAAKAMAALFVEEFGEPIDCDKTDWDAVAWQEDRREIGIDPASSDWNEGWPVYQAALVAETERLSNDAKSEPMREFEKTQRLMQREQYSPLG